MSNRVVTVMSPLPEGSSMLKTCPTKAGPPPALELETSPSILTPEAKLLIADDGDGDAAPWLMPG